MTAIRPFLLVLLASAWGCASSGPYLVNGTVPESRKREAWRDAIRERTREMGYTSYENGRAVVRMASLGLRTPIDADTTGWVLGVRQRGCGFISIGCRRYDVLIAAGVPDLGPGEEVIQIIVYGIQTGFLGSHKVIAPTMAARSDAGTLLRLIQ